MDTTAEGAETHDELDLIRELGCSHIQGYIFGRPMNRRGGRRARRPEQGGHRRRLPVQPAAAPGPAQGREPAVERHEHAGPGAQHLDRRRPARMRPDAAGRIEGPARSARLRQSRRRGALDRSASAWASSSRTSSTCAGSPRARATASAPSCRRRPIPTSAMPRAPPTRRRSPRATCATGRRAEAGFALRPGRKAISREGREGSQRSRRGRRFRCSRLLPWRRSLDCLRRRYGHGSPAGRLSLHFFASFA